MTNDELIAAIEKLIKDNLPSGETLFLPDDLEVRVEGTKHHSRVVVWDVPERWESSRC